jgi:hypothetical protein
MDNEARSCLYFLERLSRRSSAGGSYQQLEGDDNATTEVPTSCPGISQDLQELYGPPAFTPKAGGDMSASEIHCRFLVGHGLEMFTRSVDGFDFFLRDPSPIQYSRRHGRYSGSYFGAMLDKATALKSV